MKRVPLLLLFLLLCLSFNSFAQTTIQLTNPNFPTSPIKEGDDFFTAVMNNPLDFNERRDFMWEKNFEESTIDDTPDGVWSGNVLADASLKTAVWPLYQGFTNTLKPGLFGPNYPLDASKYTLFSSYDIISQRHRKVILWSNDTSPAELSKSTGLLIDGYQNANSLILHDNDKPIIDLIDLSSYSTWANNIQGVRLDPIHTAVAGSNVKYDWIRISDPNSAPKITFQWTVENPPNQIAEPHVHIYVDTDASGNDGVLIKRLPYTDNQYEFPTAALPPGEYYFYIELKKNAGNPDPVLATSGYSSKLIINGKPKIVITDPTYTSGADYATEVLNNPWDMEDAEDIINEDDPVEDNQIENPSFTGGAFCATSLDLSPNDPDKHSDSKLFLNVDPNKPISTSKYRYVTIDWIIDDTGYGNISNKVGDEGGWVSRFSWANQNFATDGSITQLFINYEGRRTYSVDLHKDGILEFGDGGAVPNTGWLGNEAVKIFRFDPLENSMPTKFTLYDMKLTAVPLFTNDLYTVKFTTQDIEMGGGTVEFFYDTDNKGVDGVSLGSPVSIASFGGESTYEINSSGLPNAELFIYAKITDNVGNINYSYSDVPLSNISTTCQDQVIVNTPTNNTTYTGKNILSDGTISENSAVIFHAETSISLIDGFSVNAGGDFFAGLKSCSGAFTAEENYPSTSRQVNQDNNKEFDLKVYPNPFSRNTMIEYYLPNNTEVSIRVYNMAGQESQILVDKEQLTAGNHQVIFEPNNSLENGMYMIVFQDDTHYKVEKIFYQK